MPSGLASAFSSISSGMVRPSVPLGGPRPRQPRFKLNVPPPASSAAASDASCSWSPLSEAAALAMAASATPEQRASDEALARLLGLIPGSDPDFQEGETPQLQPERGLPPGAVDRYRDCREPEGPLCLRLDSSGGACTWQDVASGMHSGLAFGASAAAAAEGPQWGQPEGQGPPLPGPIACPSFALGVDLSRSPQLSLAAFGSAPEAPNWHQEPTFASVAGSPEQLPPIGGASASWPPPPSSSFPHHVGSFESYEGGLLVPTDPWGAPVPIAALSHVTWQLHPSPAAVGSDNPTATADAAAGRGWRWQVAGAAGGSGPGLSGGVSKRVSAWKRAEIEAAGAWSAQASFVAASSAAGAHLQRR